MSTWSHLCNSTNSFVVLNTDQECTICGINNTVQTLRLDGYAPMPVVLRGPSPKLSTARKIAALFRPKSNPYKT